MASTYEVKNFRQLAVHFSTKFPNWHTRISAAVSQKKVSTHLLLGTPSPFRIEALAIIERLLRPHSCGRKSGIQIGTSHDLQFRQAFREKHGEAADECVARAGAVDRFDRKRGNVFA